MDRNARRAAVAAWKGKPADAGIYAFRQESGPVWVGASPRLSAIENRLRFSLRAGGPGPAGLLTAWAGAGGEGFRFEVLERLDPELTALERDIALKAALAAWRERLGAEAV